MEVQNNFLWRLFTSFFVLLFSIGIIFSQFNFALFIILLFLISYEWFFFCFSNEKSKDYKSLVTYTLLFSFAIFPSYSNFLIKIFSSIMLLLLTENFLMLAFGIIYFRIFLTSALNLITINEGIYLFTLIMIAFASDIGGYIFGKIMNGKRILPYLSPNKTTPGFFGAIFLPLILLFLISWFNDLNISINNVLFVIFYSIIAILGDLIMSFAKRISCLKNSSNILPGHGGILDRIDSIILVVIIANNLIHYR